MNPLAYAIQGVILQDMRFRGTHWLLFAGLFIAALLFLPRLVQGTPTDKDIQDTFSAHEADFNTLVDMTHEDKVLQRITPDGMLSNDPKYRGSHTGPPSQFDFPEDRFAKYQELMKNIGARYLFTGSGGAIAFTSESWTANDVVYGYSWKPMPPAAQEIIKSIDELPPSQPVTGQLHYNRYIPLKGNWYIVFQQ
ncbi:MAG TPA: hypothetical protein VGC34_00115 [Steroidobacteraceae bacterium]